MHNENLFYQLVGVSRSKWHMLYAGMGYSCSSIMSTLTRFVICPQTRTRTYSTTEHTILIVSIPRRILHSFTVPFPAQRNYFIYQYSILVSLYE